MLVNKNGPTTQLKAWYIQEPKVTAFFAVLWGLTAKTFSSPTQGTESNGFPSLSPPHAHFQELRYDPLPGLQVDE